MERRTLLRTLGLVPLGMVAKSLTGGGAAKAAPKTGKSFLTVAHITDVHIHEKDNAPERFKKVLRQITEQHKPDFFLNGGDSIHDASYDTVSRERMLRQWAIWDDCLKEIKDYEIYSCIGNHDSWWKAPDQSDEMYGKDYAARRLGIPRRYYSFKKGKWHFIILDGNNDGISLDQQQFDWLKRELEGLEKNTPVLVMSHFPILGVTPVLVGGAHKDAKELKDLFYQHQDKVRVCLAGHNHLSDRAAYNKVQYYCNGAMSGFWWGKGDKDSAGPGYYFETPPGYAILKLYDNGELENTYYPHGL